MLNGKWFTFQFTKMSMQLFQKFVKSVWGFPYVCLNLFASAHSNFSMPIFQLVKTENHRFPHSL